MKKKKDDKIVDLPETNADLIAIYEMYEILLNQGKPIATIADDCFYINLVEEQSLSSRMLTAGYLKYSMLYCQDKDWKEQQYIDLFTKH